MTAEVGGELPVEAVDGRELRFCIECKESIDVKARKCRHCGAYQRRSERWLGPLVTILSLIVAILSLVVSSKDQAYDLLFPRTALFATLEKSESATARLVVQNESADSVVIEKLMCFLKVATEPDDPRFVDSYWSFDQSGIVSPGSVFERDVNWMGSGITEDNVDSRVNAPLPFEFAETRRWSSSCACDPDRDPNETVTNPVAVCRVYFRSSRRPIDFYDFIAGEQSAFLENMRKVELGLPKTPENSSVLSSSEASDANAP